MKILKKYGAFLIVPLLALLWIAVLRLYNIEKKDLGVKDIESVISVGSDSIITLPEPKYTSSVSIEEALRTRRSAREYKNEDLSLGDISQILWAAYGVTDTTSYRNMYLKTTPSAGAIFPLNIYIAANGIDGLSNGLYQYIPINHTIKLLDTSDYARVLYDASYMTASVLQAPITLIYTASFNKMLSRYNDNGMQFVYIELGHSAQNVYLQCVSLKLGTCVVGMFETEQVKTLLHIPQSETPLYLMPIGVLKEE